MARGRCHSQFHGAGAWPSLSSGRCVTTRSKRPRLEALGSDLHCFELQPHQRTETTPTHGSAVVLKGRQRSAKAPTSDKNSPGSERALHDQLPWEETVAPTKQCRSKQNYPRPGWREIASCKERRALVWLHVWIQVGCWRLPILKWFQWGKQKCNMSWELENNAWVVPNRLASFFGRQINAHRTFAQWHDLSNSTKPRETIEIVSEFAQASTLTPQNKTKIHGQTKETSRWPLKAHKSARLSNITTRTSQHACPKTTAYAQ